MTASPEFPNQEMSNTEYGPKPLRVGTLLEIFEEEGRSPKFGHNTQKTWLFSPHF